MATAKPTAAEEGEITYRAWYAAMGGTDRDGNPLFPWWQLPAPVRYAFKAAASGALAQAARAAAARTRPAPAEGPAG